MTRTPCFAFTLRTVATAATVVAAFALNMAPVAHAQQPPPAQDLPAAAQAPHSSPKALHQQPLLDTAWTLLSLQGQSVSPQPGQEREVSITLGSESRQVQGFTGCNALLGGPYTLSGLNLKFDQLASTRKMCAPDANALEREVMSALRATTSYHLAGKQLLLLGDGRVLARFGEHAPR